MTQTGLDHLDRLILNAIQKDFPVAGRPYAVLAQRLNAEHGLALDETELLGRVHALKQNGFIRRLGAVFTPAPLGYRSTLCAARVPADKVEEFGRLVSRSPQVTHNYLRSDDLNVWFTFTGRDQEELDRFLTALKAESGLSDIHVLESEKLFKIKVQFNFT